MKRKAQLRGIVGLVTVLGVLSGCSTSSNLSSGTPLGSAFNASPSITATLWTGPPLTTIPMSATDRAMVDTMLNSAISSSKGQIDGVWIGIWSPEKGTYIAAYGNANTGRRVRATVDDRGRIGSITKSLVATLILRQVASGAISKGSTIGQVLPDLAAQYPLLANVTVEQMLTMTSGIPDYTEVADGMKQIATQANYNPTPAQLVAKAMTGAVELNTHNPQYSNTNYIILGLMLEKLTGKPANVAVNDLVSSLGMNSTAMPAPGDNTIPAPASTGYNHKAGVSQLSGMGVTEGPAVDNISGWGWTAGSMFSTVNDLGVWAGTGLGSSLLPAELAKTRLTGGRPINSGTRTHSEGLLDWGNGWIGHEGQAVGWESTVAYNTKTGAAFVAIVNETGSLTSIAGIQQKFFPDLTDGQFIQPLLGGSAPQTSASP